MRDGTYDADRARMHVKTQLKIFKNPPRTAGNYDISTSGCGLDAIEMKDTGTDPLVAYWNGTQ